MKSWSDFQRLILPLAIGAVVGGALLAAVQLSLSKSAKDALFLGDFGPERSNIEDLQRQIAEGGPDLGSLREELERISEEAQREGFNPVSSAAIGRFSAKAGAAILLGQLIHIAAFTYFLIIILAGKSLTVEKALRKTGQVYLPMIGLTLWIALRSFIWIPFIGIITGIIFLPRLAFAPILYLTEQQKGVLAASSESYAKTSGHWGKIFGNLFLFGLIVAVVLMLLGIVTSILGSVLSPIASSILTLLGSAFGAAFLVRLGKTVTGKPA